MDTRRGFLSTLLGAGAATALSNCVAPQAIPVSSQQALRLEQLDTQKRQAEAETQNILTKAQLIQEANVTKANGFNGIANNTNEFVARAEYLASKIKNGTVEKEQIHPTMIGLYQQAQFLFGANSDVEAALKTGFDQIKMNRPAAEIGLSVEGAAYAAARRYPSGTHTNIFYRRAYQSGLDERLAGNRLPTRINESTAAKLSATAIKEYEDNTILANRVSTPPCMQDFFRGTGR
jgi:hypothetical protein